jgi:hypothetical protein
MPQTDLLELSLSKLHPPSRGFNQANLNETLSLRYNYEKHAVTQVNVTRLVLYGITERSARPSVVPPVLAKRSTVFH